MANPTWFDAAHYKAQKLAQLQATDSNGGWTTAKLDTVLTGAGFGGAEGAFAHFSQYGSLEHCSPNAAFNGAEYLAGKLAQLQKVDSAWLSLGLSDVQAALAKAGLGEWDHYQLYGSKEGINADNSFDDNAYLTAKLGQLVATDAANWTGKNIVDVREALSANGLSPLAHYLAYGKGEGLTATAVADDAKVTVPADFYIFGGKGGMPSTGFELTRGADNLTGTAGSDSFFAANPDGFETLNASDTLNGGAGDDTLYIGNGAGAQNFATANIKGIENVVNAGTAPIDISGNKDVVNLTTKGSATVTLAQNVTLQNDIDGVVAVIKTVDAAGADDADTLKLVNNDLTGLTVQDIEKLTIDVTGKNSNHNDATDTDSAITFTDQALKELTVTGEGSVMLHGGGSAGSLSKVDFTANKGGVELTVAGTNLAKDVTVTGGVGDDSFIIDGTTATKKITLDLGAGADTVEVNTNVHKDSKFVGGEGTDTLVLNTFVITEDNGKQFSGFEDVVLKGVSTFDGDFLKGISSVTAEAHAGTTSVDNYSDIIITDGIGAAGARVDTLKVLSVTNDAALTLTFDNLQDGKAAEAGVTIGNLTADSTKLFIHSEGNASSTNAMAMTTANGTIQKITIDGDQDFALTTGATTSLTDIDASGLSGKFILVSTATDDTTIKGGSGGNDIVSTAAKQDEIYLGKSVGVKDTITVANVTDAGRDTIYSFDAGVDGDVIELGADGSYAEITKIHTISAGDTIKSTATTVSTDDFNRISGDLGADATSADALATRLGTDGIVGSAAGNVGYILAYGAGNAYVYYYAATDTNSAISTAELALVTVLDGVDTSTLDASNFMI